MLREMFDTPYHIGYLKMDENDSRRDKRRCIYFERNENCSSYCRRNSVRCPGSSHCQFYNENTDNLHTSDELIKEMKKNTEARNKYLEYPKNLSQKRKESDSNLQFLKGRRLITVEINEVNVLKDNILFELVMKYIYKKKLKYECIQIDDITTFKRLYEIKCITLSCNNKIKLISESDFKNFIKDKDLKNVNIKFNLKDDNYKDEIINLIEK